MVTNNNKMGYRTTITTNHYPGELPLWFHEKYNKDYFINGTLVASKKEKKHYNSELLDDLKCALGEIGFWENKSIPFYVVIMGSDGFLTRAIITKHDIEYVWSDIGDGLEVDEIWAGGL